MKIKIEKDILLPLLRAHDCGRYCYSNSSKYVIYPYKLVNDKTTILPEDELKKEYPNAYNYLLSNKDLLKKRKDSRKTFSTKKNWYSLTRFGRIDIFKKTKITFPRETKNNKFGWILMGQDIVEVGFFLFTSESCISLKISFSYFKFVVNQKISSIIHCFKTRRLLFIFSK